MLSGESLDIDGLAPGTVVEVETRSRTYRIEFLGGKSVRISGHPEHCPTPTAAQVHGSISKAGGLEYGRISKGSRLMFFLNGNQPITTSAIVSFKVTQPRESQSSSGIH